MSTGIIIQARVGSTRLPHKMILPFYDGKSVFELLLEKLTQFKENKLVLATSTNKLDDDLVKLAQKKDIKVFRGSEENVLLRFVDAAKAFSFEKVIRICADNPFLDLGLLKEVIKNLDNNNIDYVSYGFKNGTPVIKSHVGVFCEGVKTEALEKVLNKTDESLYMEHVTNYIYEHPNIFNIKWLELPNFLEKSQKEIRLTLDTLEDFELYQRIFPVYLSNSCSTQYLIEYCLKDSEILSKMKKQIEDNSK